MWDPRIHHRKIVEKSLENPGLPTKSSQDHSRVSGVQKAQVPRIEKPLGMDGNDEAKQPL